jgi:hypothetical protein
MKITGSNGLALALSLVACKVAAQSGTVSLWDGPYSSGVGSEFTALATPSLLGGYAATTLQVANGQTGFQTFCVQTAVDISPGTSSYPPLTYNYTLSLSSVGSPDAFPLSEGTAWLYAQFAQGLLNNYDYANTGSNPTPGAGAGRATDAAALQSALWYLQGGQAWPSGYVFGGAGNIYYNEALSYFGSLSALDANATLSTDFGVQIMDLSLAGSPAQDQLVYVGSAVPEGGPTLALLAAGLASLAACKRLLAEA